VSLAVTDLTKSYSRKAPPALRLVTFEADPGELLVVVGPSGSGKSTLLRCIAGLERPDRGTVSVAGTNVTTVDPGRRDVAMVFQEHALYPHLDVATNIAFPLLARKVARDEIETSVANAAEMLDLSHVLSRLPGELSGGERRRVSLARAVVRRPAAFLMDEPLSNLDAALKLKVQAEIRALQQDLGVTTLYVTHDQTEAMTLGHRIAVLRDGGLEQIGAPLELYDRPANVFVATFLGRTPMNLFPADMFGAPDGAHTIGVRPEAVTVGLKGTAKLEARIAALDHLGSDVLVEAEAGGLRVFLRVPRENAPDTGDEVSLGFDAADAYLFDADGSRIER
jgi:ABC-type sugar transport system ATPase subunit